ncbi:MAG: GTP 3',8-cyclase MoaA [Candidatus Korarchaeum sp.]|nr:GTP 3',8-cyclase MoaA [Candidatus Korarchaeum sp.]MDW8035940.1 GTP 3',8-cyclase MoaA [Candidatus Korarchaeum sp.]
MLIDKWGRPVSELRISVTKSCNYSCFFCHREGHYVGEDEMEPKEFGKLLRVLSKHGVKKVKLTGGEPLMRKDLEDVIEEIRSSEVEEVSLVTNGFFLKERAKSLKEAGLDRVNVSLHSLRKDVYTKITGVDGLERAIEGINEALRRGISPVKVNFTVIRGLNEEELWDVVKFARNRGLRVQFIEILERNPSLEDYHYSLEGFEKELESLAVRKEVKELHNRPIFYLEDGTIVEIVRGSGDPLFCMKCTRARVTHDGFFKPCIYREDNLVDFLSVMRRGGGDEEILERFKQFLRVREPYYKLLGSSPKYDDILEV